MLGRKGAIKYWILFILQEDRQQPWDEIAQQVLQPCCGILDHKDLPPDVSWDEVRDAFHEMARRSRSLPSTLTPEALKRFYSRARDELLRPIWSMMVEALGREEAIMKWMLDRLYERLEHHPGEKIEALVLQPRCGILTDRDLPPDVLWDEVQQAFQAMAQRSANPGTLTPEVLCEFYECANEKLRQYGREHPQADPRQ